MLPFDLTDELKSAFDGYWIKLSNLLSDYGIEEKYINFELNSIVLHPAMGRTSQTNDRNPKNIDKSKLGGRIESRLAITTRGLAVM